MSTVAVTGGTGYIAGFVIAEFLNHGYDVRASVRDLAKMDALKDGLHGWVGDEALGRLTGFEADLTSITGWAQGFFGADGVIHVASPLGTSNESAETLNRVAKGGTLNVLQAARDSGVRRVVMTSSGAACIPKVSAGSITVDETFWSDPNNNELSPYRKSKVAAEKAAWDFAHDNHMDLTTILPGTVFGPIMRKGIISSDEMLRLLLNKSVPAVVDTPLDITDVRDLAVLHRLAFENDVATGERFLATGPAISLPEVAKWYQERFTDSTIPTKTCPMWMVYMLSLVPSLRQLPAMVHRKYSHTAFKAESLLGWTQRPPQETVMDAAQSLAEHGLVSSNILTSACGRTTPS